jgi:hypothetical protein
MDRAEFEKLRDLPGKSIEGDIALSPPMAGAAYLESEKIPILNSEDVPAFVVVRWNPQTDSKTVNVAVRGVGPICRLDVDGRIHEPAGRHHKHSLRSAACPEENLKRDLQRRDDLAGATIQQVFAEFCRIAGVEHVGTLKVPE